MKYPLLILAPRGRDADVAAKLLEKNGIKVLVCRDLDALVDSISSDVGGVMITEEALAAADAGPLTDWVASQPTWSDLPFIVLANGNKAPRSAAATERLERLGNTVLLERPLHADGMLGAVRSALKARSRQYEVRGFAEAMEKAVLDRTAQLEKARDSLEVALNAADMGSWDIDLTTGTATRTLRHDQIFGYSELLSEWTVEIFLRHVDQEQRAAIAAEFEAAPTSGFIDFECGIMTAGGEHRWISAKGSMRYDSAGRPERMTGVVSDITARKETDAQLAQAQKMDAIGQLTGGVAHDFNNLLTPIVGSLDLLRCRVKDDERSQRMIAGALHAAERASTLTQRLLAFARRQALQPRAIDIGALIDGMVDLIQRSLGPSITVALEVPPNLPAARVDPNQLELALLNLAINARDAMPGGGRLIIAASRVAVGERNAVGIEAGDYLRLATIDTGIGMDQSTLARATEPFFSTKGLGRGTGLGLSMAHGLAAQSGGILNITSQPGKGTTVELWLPISDEQPGEAVAATNQPIPARQSARILLVDDEELVRTATAEMLRDIGYDVTEAGSASQALSALRSGIGADLLVTDYLMPGMNGAQLIRELRSAGIGLPSLLVTGYAAAGEDVPSDIPRLAKPFRQRDLATHVDALLRSISPGKVELRSVQ